MKQYPINYTPGQEITLSDKDGRTIYCVRWSNLAKSDPIHESLSAVILELACRDASLADMYELAARIEKEFPNNVIDWTWTFSIVENGLPCKCASSTEFFDQWMKASDSHKTQIDNCVELNVLRDIYPQPTY